MNDEPTPYYSKRMTIRDMKPTKDTLGLRYKERTLEVTLGNTRETVTVTNPNDVADIRSQSMKDLFADMIKDSDELAVEGKWKFIDKLESSNK